jgi:hypothetical protein
MDTRCAGADIAYCSQRATTDVYEYGRSRSTPLQKTTQYQNDYKEDRDYDPTPRRDWSLLLDVGHVHREPQKAEGEQGCDPKQRPRSIIRL